MTERRFGLVEAGGTKFILGIAKADGVIGETTRIETTLPTETLPAMVDWFAARGRLDAFGIASFGPVELDQRSPHWGKIGNTPKPGWAGADLAARLRARFGCPIFIDTDVAGAALAEQRWGAGQGSRTVLYFTIGTGIGGAAAINGRVLRGVSHSEMGHMRVARHADDQDFPGVCPFHGDCLEGLASGPAIKARWGASLSDLPHDHAGHGIVAHYLAQAVSTMQAVFEPDRVILGGGVMGTPGLIDRVRAEAGRLSAGYFRSDPAQIVTRPGLGSNAGLLGALAVALDGGGEEARASYI